MLATLVIFLREGIEASMIVAILLAYLNRSGNRKYFRDVYAGVAAALLLAAGGGILAYYTIRAYDGSQAQTIFETATYLLAAVILTYMTFWMQSHSRGMSSELAARADAAISAGNLRRAGNLTRAARWGVALLAFQAVGREGLETVVFTLAIAFSTTTSAALLGATIGVAIALVIAFVIYKLGHRLNLGRFFSIVGVVLMLFAAGLLVDAVQNLQELGVLPFGNQVLWNTGRVLSEDGALGDVLHSFFGYADTPTVLQAVVYLAYIAIAVYAFIRLRAPKARVATPVV